MIRSKELLSLLSNYKLLHCKFNYNKPNILGYDKKKNTMMKLIY